MVILLDIEGTTTPIDFVHKTLFPYSWDRVGLFIARNMEALADELDALQSEAERDAALGSYQARFDRDSADSVADYLRHLIDIDRKSTTLKAIQGMVWRDGYESGDLRSEVYPDVPEAFERWHSEGRPISIFSSGSVLAQRLLFSHTSYGDLTRFISRYFDTNTGHKRDGETYLRIAEMLETDPRDVLFVSDVDAELDAAASAGMMTRLSIREGNPSQENESGHMLIRSLEEIT